MENDEVISKSQYLRGLQCPKALWLYRNRPDLKPENSPTLQHRFDSGHEVGLLAQKCFDGGVEIVEEYHKIDDDHPVHAGSCRQESAGSLRGGCVLPGRRLFADRHPEEVPGGRGVGPGRGQVHHELQGLSHRRHGAAAIRFCRGGLRHTQVGSASLKSVLPAFAPDLSYAGLAIADGETASLMYLKTFKSELPEEEKERIYADLLDYCCLDTLAEVRLLEELYRAVG